MRDWKKYIRENLASLALGPERELEIVDEMAQHLESVYQDALDEGLSEADAFGRATAHIKDWHLLECELVRARRPAGRVFQNNRLAAGPRVEPPHGAGGFGMGSLILDLRYATRMLLKNKAFTAVAVLSLALGIGANTALFSLVDTVLLKTLPAKNPNELVLFNWLSGPRGLSRGIDGTIKTDKATGLRTSTSFSYLTFQRFQDHNETLSDVFAFARLYELHVSLDGRPEIATGQLVSGNYYAGLGVKASMGRTINAEDDAANAAAIAVITHRYWQRRFGGDPNVIGKTIIVNNIPSTVIGVTPRDFEGALQIGESADVSVPFALEPRMHAEDPSLSKPWSWWVQIMGRLNANVTLDQAAASFEASFQQSAQEGWEAALVRFPPRAGQTPAPRDIPRLRAGSGSQGLTESRSSYSEPLKILMIIVGLVLMIACANIANLLLARSAARQKEIGVRLAIGASRRRLIRQLLTESVLLSLLGGLGGVAFAYWGKEALLSLRPWGIGELVLDLKIDSRVLFFTFAVSMLTGLLFGIVPALRATRVDLTSALKDSARGAIGRPHRYLAKTLTIAQVAMSLVLLVNAGLFVRTLVKLQDVNIGFNRENLLLFNVDPSLNGYPRPQIAQLYGRLTERLEATPGVRSASVSLIPPLAGYGRTSTIIVQDHAQSGGEDSDAKINTIGETFFDTLEIPILLGRGITSRDDERAPKVAVINQTMARKYFGDASPIGQRFGFGGPDTSGDIEIIGVARDAKYAELRSEIEPAIYLPYKQSIPSSATFVLRTGGNIAAITSSVREAVHEVDGNLAIFAVKTQRQQVDESLTQERLFATLSSFFGILAMLLVCIGLYGVTSYGVSRRTNEIGIRMALGATAPRVKLMVLRETMLMVGIGAVIGLGAAFATTRLVTSMLFGLAANDPLTVVVSVGVMVAVTGLAGYIPARRAAAVDPMIALRYE